VVCRRHHCEVGTCNASVARPPCFSWWIKKLAMRLLPPCVAPNTAASAKASKPRLATAAVAAETWKTFCPSSSSGAPGASSQTSNVKSNVIATWIARWGGLRRPPAVGQVEPIKSVWLGRGVLVKCVHMDAKEGPCRCPDALQYRLNRCPSGTVGVPGRGRGSSCHPHRVTLRYRPPA
jgi:hypothetical protein